jgi:predicted RNase H-like HicB family nuclease
MPKYGFDIFWSDEDQGYIATCPDFPGLSAFGVTEEEALQEAKSAMQLFVEAIRDQGKPTPEATTVNSIATRHQRRRLGAPATA